MRKFFILLAFSLFIYNSFSQDQVLGLENVTGYNQTWYSGYVQASNSQQQIHYFFFPCQNQTGGVPTDYPILLWLNGGPGCSSMLGATQENGPFVFITQTNQTMLNPFSWNYLANILYFESPPGVGFSLTNTINWDDNTTAMANADALWNWFQKYQEYNASEFYIAGESYAGVYVPTLAYQIDQYNKQNHQNFTVNFKGFMVGNPCTEKLECAFSGIEPFVADTFYHQSFIPLKFWENYKQKCPNVDQYSSQVCIDAYNKIYNQGNYVNGYDLIRECYYGDYPPVPPNSSKLSQNQNFENQNQLFWKKRRLHQQKNMNLQQVQQTPEDYYGIPPCVDGVGPVWFFNNQSNQQKLNIINSTNQTYLWTMCTNNLNYTTNFLGSYQFYPYLIQQGYRIWVYSGDTDSSVPTEGTLYWVMKLRQELGLYDIIPWRPWYTDGEQENNRQNAGQYWQMDGLSVVLFKGVGHMAVQWNKIGGYDMLYNFLNNQPLPNQ